MFRTRASRLCAGIGLTALVVTSVIAVTKPSVAESTDSGSGYTANITNPYFPLVPGRTLVYKGTKDDKAALDYFTTTHQVVQINGKPTRLVLDRLFLDGKLAETTADYYTQDPDGNVRYMGEDTASIDENGNMEVFGTDGTWHANEFGAIAGTFMPTTPEVGASYRQEYLPDHAEDHFQILDLSASVTVPYGSYSDALKTKEWTPLEPDVLDNKYYVKGIGMVKEIAVKGPAEQLSLIAIK
ncbi:MAG: hypothetical protein QOI61_1555 [Actinomycetota bacterium]|jgi:hypothetical protein